MSAVQQGLDNCQHTTPATLDLQVLLPTNAGLQRWCGACSLNANDVHALLFPAVRMRLQWRIRHTHLEYYPLPPAPDP
jgi:hypothetical protein